MGRLLWKIALPSDDSLKDLTKSRLREVSMMTRLISTTAAPQARPSLRETMEHQEVLGLQTAPNILVRTTLLARNIVIITATVRRMLAHRGWGLSPMNCSSLRQSSSRVEKKGRRQPLKTWATRMT